MLTHSLPQYCELYAAWKAWLEGVAVLIISVRHSGHFGILIQMLLASLCLINDY